LWQRELVFWLNCSEINFQTKRRPPQQISRYTSKGAKERQQVRSSRLICIRLSLMIAGIRIPDSGDSRPTTGTFEPHFTMISHTEQVTVGPLEPSRMPVIELFQNCDPVVSD
jgi:hypothetical protein